MSLSARTERSESGGGKAGPARRPRMPLRAIRATIVSAVLATSALAHDVTTGPNGGRVVDAASHHVELVVRGRAVTVFVTDAAHRPVPLEGFKGVAVLTADGKAHRVVLEVQQETRLAGVAPVSLPAAPKGVVQATAPDGTVLQARFR